MPQVIVLDELAPEGLELLRQLELDFEVRTGLKGQQLTDALNDCDGAICRSGVKLTAEVLEGVQRLKAVVRAGVGTDNIDKPMATRRGIVVMNTPTGNTLSTAEHTFTLLLALSRNVAPAYQSLIEGRWDRKAYMGSQVADKTLGIVGVMGRIGQEVAKRALAFQMKVIGFDVFATEEQAAKLGIELAASVDEMLPHVDYLTVHTPLNSETKNLIDHQQLERMRDGVRLINCARGGIYNEQALAAGLSSGKIAGIALDVFSEEPCKESPLFGMPGVLCTPHLGASTDEAQTKVALEAVQLLSNYLKTGEIRHSVNVAAVDPAMLRDLQGYLDLAYRLGRLMAQLHEGSDACRLTYRGEIARGDHQLITAAFCTGLLEGAMDQAPNIVNAVALLEERGIPLTVESDTTQGPFSSSITAELTVGGQSHLASGTLFGTTMPRLIRLDEHRLEAYLDGNMLIFTHDDVPGIIGSVGTTFGKHGVNIAQMAVGRAGESPGGGAIGILNLDEPAPQEAIDEVLAHDHIRSVKMLRLPAAGELPGWLG